MLFIFKTVLCIVYNKSPIYCKQYLSLLYWTNITKSVNELGEGEKSCA